MLHVQRHPAWEPLLYHITVERLRQHRPGKMTSCRLRLAVAVAIAVQQPLIPPLIRQLPQLLQLLQPAQRKFVVLYNSTFHSNGE
jgi:hypothetical protein